jgi:signal transduction histidine kinase
LRRRLLVSYLAITVLVLVVLEIPLGISFARSERDRLESDVERDAFTLAIRAEETIEQPGTAGSAEELLALVDRYEDETGGRVVIVDSSGEVLADSDPLAPEEQDSNFANRPEIAEALDGHEAIGTRHSDTLGGDLLYVAIPVLSGTEVTGAIRVTYPMSFVNDRIRNNWLLLAATGGVVLLAVLLVSLWLARSFTRPVADLESAAARLGAGDLTTRAAVPTTPPEIRVLAEEFNRTAAQLEQLIDAQREFVADASHQLRTPLAALRLRLENLENNLEPGAYEDLEGAQAEVRRLSRLVDGLLVLAQSERAGTARVAIDVREVIEGRREAWGAFASERNVTIDALIQDAPLARATSGRLEQVLDNLLNNALEVAPAGSHVTLTAGTRGGRVELRVIDAGPGMSDAERARAFDRFWRATSSADANGGFGLGLAIVRQLVAADGGEVHLDASAAGGLEVVIELPTAR